MNYLSNIFKNKEMFLIKFFFFIICTIYFYQINKFVNNNVHATTTWWLYNYSQGFIKRGFVGEILFFLTKTFNIDIFVLLKFFHSFLFLTFIYLFFNYIKKLKNINYAYLLLIFSPIGLMAYIYDPFFVGRAEILIFISLIIYINILQNKPSHYKVILISLFSFFSILIHESYIFYLSYFFLFHIFFIKKKKYEIKFFYTFIILPITAILIILFFDRPIDSSLMCKNIYKLEYYSKICTEQILAGSKIMGFKDSLISVKNFVISNNYFIVYSILGVLILTLLLIFLSIISLESKFLIKNFLFILLNFLYSLPIFFLSYDWGRWLFVHGMILIIIFGLYLNENKSRIFNLKNKLTISLISVIFISTWSIPHCCSVNIGGGFFAKIIQILNYI
jgi:hypothetical protein